MEDYNSEFTDEETSSFINLMSGLNGTAKNELNCMILEDNFRYDSKLFSVLLAYRLGFFSGGLNYQSRDSQVLPFHFHRRGNFYENWCPPSFDSISCWPQSPPDK